MEFGLFLKGALKVKREGVSLMDGVERFLRNNNLQDADDIDSFIELASLVRKLIGECQYACINQVINYTLEHSYYEAFSWCMGIMQEALDNETCEIDNFECDIGRSIPDYDAFIERLHVDFKVYRNEFETVCDSNGEVDSFFNILVYETCYRNIHLVSYENFDTKDNDFVQYRLSFIKG